ncbi:MAG: 30S ribosomal protein S20 [Candidatus Omnitrophota bacterium]|nr:MAG: 30S ribosomal protein S20 [Candidatus Omnitrophota bacterium]
MPIKKSAFKELRKAKKRHLRNIGAISELKTLNKKFLALVDEKKVEQAKKILNQLSSKLDKASSKKIIHKNKAWRKKSRLMRKLTKV